MVKLNKGFLFNPLFVMSTGLLMVALARLFPTMAYLDTPGWVLVITGAVFNFRKIIK